MGEGTGAADQQVPARDAGEEEAGRAERAHAPAPAGARGPREEHDAEEGQEEGVAHEEDAGAREVRARLKTSGRISGHSTFKITRKHVLND